MKVSKYPQSCLLIEESGKRILIDPGTLVSESFTAKDLLPIDAIFITHEHFDRADPKLIKTLTSSSQIPVYANEGVKKSLGDAVNNVVSDGDVINVGNVKVSVHNVPHVDMVSGDKGPQNTGFLVADKLFHPGDGVDSGAVEASVAAAPLSGPDISPRDVFDYIKKIKCQVVIPIHYDYFPAKPEMFEAMAENIVPDVKFVNLENGKSADI